VHLHYIMNHDYNVFILCLGMLITVGLSGLPRKVELQFRELKNLQMPHPIQPVNISCCSKQGTFFCVELFLGINAARYVAYNFTLVRLLYSTL